MTALALPCLIAGLLAQAADADTKKDADERLAFMRRTLEAYKIGPAADTEQRPRFRFQADPVLRFTNPVGNAPAQDGGIFFWRSEGDRPEAAVQIFYRRKSDTWMQEFMSFSPEPLIADLGDGRPWAPTRGGVQFRPVPGAPTPAETPAQRLRQMRDLAGDFTAEEHFQLRSWERLRLLAKPLAHYGKPGTSVVDGAVFNFVLATDPEVGLMLEARPGARGLEWQYALAPMTIYPLKVSHKGKDVWARPFREKADNGPESPFHTRMLRAGD